MNNDTHHHEHAHITNEGKLGFALVLTLVYMVAEVVGGLIFHSLALLADSGHMLSDAMALGLSWLAIRVGRKKPGDRHTFGFRRTEILAALFNGLALWGIVGIIFYEAAHRFYNPVSVEGWGMLLVALFGLIINLVMAAILYRSAADSINIRGAFLHVMSDALGSLGAVVAGLIIIYTSRYWVDPLISVLIGILILYSSWELISESFHILMEGVPKGYDAGLIESGIAGVNGVCCVYDLHIWSITGSEVNLSAHVVLSEESPDHEEVLQEINSLLKNRFKVDHTTIQIESTHDFRREESFDKCRPGTSCSTS
jgi:cobalt-zinc-cadmium efflux system protein